MARTTTPVGISVQFEDDEVQPVAVGADRQRLTHLDERRAEDPGLLLGPLGEVGAGDAALEARGSCGSASSSRPGRRSSRARSRGCAAPRRRRTRRRRARTGPAPTTVTVCLAHLDECRAEHPRLLLGPLREVGAGDARAGSRGSCGSASSLRPGRRSTRARSRAVRKPLRGRVHGGGEPGRAGPDDRDVELARALQVGGGAVGVGDLDVGRVDQDPAVALDDDRDRRVGLPGLFEDPARPRARSRCGRRTGRGCG